MITASSAIFQKQIFSERLIKILLFLIILIWCFGITFASILPHTGIIVFYPLVKQFYSVICHQTGYKTIELNGFHFLVCARCTGIYFGALAMSVYFIFNNINLKLNPKFLIAAFLPIILDVVFYSGGIYLYSKTVAFITGAISGSAAFLYISDSIVKIFTNKHNSDE